MNTQTKQHGFTLIELLVTIGIIILIAAIALPTVSVFMNAGADASAYNLIAAQLTNARAIAIENSSYAGVHFQLNDGGTPAPTLIKQNQYAAIFRYDNEDQNFVLADGYQPQKMPGRMAVGEISPDFITSDTTGDGVDDYTNLTNDSDIRDFCSFTVVFSSEGSVVVSVPNGATNVIDFADAGPFHSQTTGPYNVNALWDRTTANGESGVSALTLFDFSELAPRSGAQRATYLNESGQFLPVNVHTGQLYIRK